MFCVALKVKVKGQQMYFYPQAFLKSEEDIVIAYALLVRLLQDGRSEVPNGPWPLQIYGVNLTRLTPQAHFNPVTPYCMNPNLTLTSLNIAVQIPILIMYRGHVWTTFVMQSPPKPWTKFNQIWCVSYSHEWGVQCQTFFGPAPWGPGEGSKGQILFNFNYKVNFKDFCTKLCVCSHK